MLMDILNAVVIVVVAAALAFIVHALLWLILIVAVLWLFTRRGCRPRITAGRAGEPRCPS